MNPERDHEEIESLLGPYVLGSVEPEEAERIRRHLPGCESCSAIVRRLERAVAAIPLTVEPLTPSTELRDRILTAAAAQAQSPDIPRPQARFRRPGRLTGRTWRRAGVLRPATAAAAVVAFALGAGLGLGIGRSISPSPAPTSNVVQYSMQGTGTMAGAQGRVFELKEQGLTLIEFSDLPELESGKVYELWLIPHHGQPVPAAVFVTDPSGSHIVLLARDLLGVSALAVTTEVGPGGASAPTQQPQLVGAVG